MISSWELIKLLFGILFVSFLAYLSIKFLGKGTYLRRKTANMQLLETLSLSIGCLLSIVKIGDKFYLIGHTKDKITYCTMVDGDSFEFQEISEINNEFSKLLNKFIKSDKNNTE